MRKYMAPAIENQPKTLKTQGPIPSKSNRNRGNPRPQPLKINRKYLKSKASAFENQTKILKIQGPPL